MDILNIRLVEGKGNLSVDMIEIYRKGKLDPKVFGLLFNGVRVHTLMLEVWKSVVNRIQKSVSDLKRAREGDYKEAHIVSYEEMLAIKKKFTSSKQAIEKKKKAEFYCNLFDLPTDETLFFTEKASVTFYKAGEKMQKVFEQKDGQLYISTHFVCFHKKSTQTKILIPIREISAAKKAISKANKDYGALGELGVIPELANIYTATHIFSFSVIKRNRVLDLVNSLMGTIDPMNLNALPSYVAMLPVLADGELPSSQSLVDHPWFYHYRHHPMPVKFPESMTSNERYFSSNFFEKEAAQEVKFVQYFTTYGLTTYMPRLHQELSTLVHNGIPDTLRGQLWLQFSGVLNEMLIDEPNVYKRLLEENQDKVSVATDQIERDLTRSIPEHPYFKSKEGIDALRRVLVAYSWHDPSIGYCQGFNFLVALFLLYMSEAEAFYLLRRVVQMAPDYYIREMLGSIVDIRVFGELMEEHIPDLSQHLKDVELDLSTVALPWFLCLYIGYVPWEVTLRVLDCFFLDGPTVLFQTGLAQFQVMKAELMAQPDQIGVASVMKSTPTDSERLIHDAFTTFSLKRETIDDLRNWHKFKAIQELEAFNTQEDIRSLCQKTMFLPEEMEQMYTTFRQALYKSSETRVAKEAFGALFSKFVPWWYVKYADDYDQLFKIIDTSGEGDLSFVELITALDRIMFGSYAEIATLCFSIYQVQDQLLISDFTGACRLMHAIMTHQQSKRVKTKVRGRMTVSKTEAEDEWALVEDDEPLTDTQIRSAWNTSIDAKIQSAKLQGQTLVFSTSNPPQLNQLEFEEALHTLGAESWVRKTTLN